MSNEMIKCTNVSFKYIKDSEGDKKEKYAVKDVNLEVKNGEFLVILGHNGSGKSTMAKHMNALVIPTEGTVVVDGLDTKEPKNVWDIRSKAGMVFQNPDNQLVATIVEEDVAFGPENLGVEPSQIRVRVDESLEKVGMSKYKRHAPHLLSGGQKQRVAIAGILAIQPECIIFDEPTAMLDPIGRKEVLKTIKELNKKHGITIILITHYMDEAAQADRIIVMDGGSVKMEGTPKEIFPRVEHMKKIGLDVPQVTELAYELKKAGIDINEKILNVDEMVNELCQLK
ncbi:energy-coupling factor transport system ATP-binding protein [Clostridium saccharoperbutylacetonicum]|uniref:Cobalt transporter ATP-binding protein CbiO n=1 Tax=Clostridium saccharoperbutylacetonicum N1-4(HMT) TaxID=931276 RepID=M1MQZ2_9CLOT|nr:energy-coupling factor transporter ATPase [Clostridium saccharoperbutylacetonicum]AGF54037.1 cobalt transporter ATP-binding protein CbiO [Clostridium saccharoperbutylacetonicum N1-4(HMT)]NRT59450.1 energy-coupling factor transport system ATP-binding protein [Clostridium saccharoperbutylacetonicum]NSB28642.1 energy-coupling factor transport system ATP-binding protein [Clostridium saccharoperbutylacetonicum]NSB42133.1 energy-coupling factor transport system ATP-binding protein [Clostridium sac